VVADLALEVVRVAVDAVDLGGGDLAHIGEAGDGVAREDEEEFAGAGEFIAPAVQAAVDGVQRVGPELQGEGVPLDAGARSDDEIRGHAHQAGGQRVRAAGVLDAPERGARLVPGARGGAGQFPPGVVIGGGGRGGGVQAPRGGVAWNAGARGGVAGGRGRPGAGKGRAAGEPADAGHGCVHSPKMLPKGYGSLI